MAFNLNSVKIPAYYGNNDIHVLSNILIDHLHIFDFESKIIYFTRAASL